MKTTDWFAIYGAALSTITFGWNAWRQLADRGRLKVYVAVLQLRPPPDYIHVAERVLGGAITNVGHKSIHLTAIIVLHEDKTRGVWIPDGTKSLYEVPNFPFELQAGAQVNFRLPLGLLAPGDHRAPPIAFCVTDTHDRVWRAPRTLFKKARAAALEHTRTPPANASTARG